MLAQTFENKSLGTITILREEIAWDYVGSYVLCVINDATAYPFAVWYRTNTGDLNTGNYSKNLDDAIENFEERVAI